MSQFKLPQQDNDPKRKEELEKWKRESTFKYDMNMPVAVTPPEINLPPFRYNTMVLKGFAKRRSTLEAQEKKAGFRFQNGLPKLKTVNFAEVIKNRDLSPLVAFFMADMGPILPNGRPTTVKDYERLYQKEPVPESARDVDSDTAFAHMFLSGSDPDVLKRMNSVPQHFPINNSHFQAAPEFASDNLETAIREGRVYFVDYTKMKDLENGKHPQAQKYMYAPLAAFAIPRGGGTLAPFAIQTGPTPNGREIYTRRDAWSWRLARAHVQTAANAHSAIISHLSLTHLLIEPIALCLYRNLSPLHPMHALLHPHFVNTLHINNAAFKSLVGPDQFVDRMLGSEIHSNYDLIAKCRRDFDFKASYLPSKFVKNQTADARILSGYAYRDDGLLIWNAIRSWVSDYVSFYYRSEADLRADVEIQNWAREIGSDKIGQVRNFASNGGVGSLHELIDTVTMIIFTAGPQHAVVNFAQRTDMSFVPSAPMAGYTPEMKGKDHSEKNWLDFLPPLDVQSVQATLCNFLGDQYWGKLGDYGKLFQDQAIVDALRKYNQTLDSIERTILGKNQSRRPFIHLLPSKIPQSINI